MFPLVNSLPQVRMSVFGWFLRGFHIWTSRCGCHITSRAAVVHVCSSTSLQTQLFSHVDANVSPHTEFFLPCSPHPFLALPTCSVLLFMPVLSFMFLQLTLFSSMLFQVLFHPKPFCYITDFVLAFSEISHHSLLLRNPFFSNQLPSACREVCSHLHLWLSHTEPWPRAGQAWSAVDLAERWSVAARRMESFGDTALSLALIFRSTATDVSKGETFLLPGRLQESSPVFPIWWFLFTLWKRTTLLSL